MSSTASTYPRSGQLVERDGPAATAPARPGNARQWARLAVSGVTLLASMVYVHRSQERVIAAVGVVVLAEVALFALPWRTILDVLQGTSLAVQAVVVGTLLLTIGAAGAGYREIRSGKVRWFWTALLILVPVIALTGIGLVVLIKAVPVAPQDAAVRIELIKTALAIGAGTGGVVALVLSGRRGWSTEHDATERRIIELYTKAVEQLGSDKAPVRLGGLYALERLAQANPGLRQTVVDVTCAYLRMPYVPPQPGVQRWPELPSSSQTTETPATDKANAVTSDRDVATENASQEREVRLTAQRILEDHLRPELGRRSISPLSIAEQRFWPDIDIDLTSATLINFRFKGCKVHKARFSEAHFLGDAHFDRTKFTGDASFEDAHFGGDALFSMTQFPQRVSFNFARFAGPANFAGAIFGTKRGAFFAYAQFFGARFDKEAIFNSAQFLQYSTFSHAQFSGNAQFEWMESASSEFDFWKARACLADSHKWPPSYRLCQDQDDSDWGTIERFEAPRVPAGDDCHSPRD